MSKVWFTLAIAVSLVGLGGISHAASDLRPAIQHVQHVKGSIHPDAESPVRLQLGQFFTESVAGDVFRVSWAPGERPLPAGVVLRLTYRHERVAAWQVLEIAYPFQVRDSRTATFEVGPRALRQGGRVVAWQVELLQQGRVLARQSSDSGEGQ